MAHPDAIPNAHRAVIHPDKLRKYVLNPSNEIGAHKARVFKSALGFTQENADELASQLLSGLPGAPAVARRSTEYGTPYSVDIPVSGPAGAAIVRTGWHVDTGSDVPRLVSAYVIGG